MIAICKLMVMILNEARVPRAFGRGACPGIGLQIGVFRAKWVIKLLEMMNATLAA